MKRTVIVVLSMAFLWSGITLAADSNRDPAHKDQQGAMEGVVKAPDTSTLSRMDTQSQEKIFNEPESEIYRVPVFTTPVADNDPLSIIKTKLEEGQQLSEYEKQIAIDAGITTTPDQVRPVNSPNEGSRTSRAFVEVGSGTSTSGYVPCYGVYDYSWSQVIYLQSEIGMGMDITDIAYNVSNTPSAYTMVNQKIFMAHTSDTAFVDGTLADTTAMTKVYDGDITWDGGGWSLITLDASFTYNNTDNLVIVFVNNDGTWSSGYPTFYYTSQTDRSVYKYQDGSPVDPGTTTGTLSYRVANIQFHYFDANPIASVSTDSVYFGMLPPGLTATKVVSISNSGGADLVISDISTTNAAFTVDVTSGTIAPDSTLDVTITYTASATRHDFYGELAITSNAASSPDNVILAGDLAPTAGGPDAFGYSWASSYDGSGPVYGWVDTTGATDSGIAGGDDYRGTIPLPFNFYFYGGWYNEITATTNGWIGMGPYTNYSSSYWTNDPIPDAGSPNNIIAPLWDDWKAGGSATEGSILYKTVGTAPNRQLVVIFHNFYRSYSNTDFYTFECILEEGTNNITLQYLDVVGGSDYANNGVGGTVGIEDGDGLIGLEFEYNGSPQLVYDGEAIQFTAPPPPVTGLMFSEYIEGSSNNKAIELYNSSLDTLNLDEYLIGQTSNGSTVGVWEYFHVFPTGATLAPGDVWVILNDAADPLLFDAANADEVLGYPSVVHHNGDDARAVLHVVGSDTIEVDLIGETGPDPGSGWDVAGVTTATANHTLIRKFEVQMGNTDWASSAGTDSANSEWLVFPQDYFTNLGGHPDDPCWDNPTTVTVVAQSYGSEKYFMVQDEAGDTLLSCFGCMSSYTTFSEELCLVDGFYTFWAQDGWGDGWDGAVFEITDADGNVLLDGGGPTSGDGTNWVTYNFSVGATPAAFNADPMFDFGGVAIDGGVVDGAIQVDNIGGSLLTVSGVELSGDGFSSTTTSFTVDPFSSYAFDISFDPTDEIGYEGYVVFTHDGDTSPDTVYVYGFGVPGFFVETFDPYTGSADVLPMEGWTILDNNGDATTIPEYRKTWYHDDYGLDGSGNMVAYIGYSNSYYADETMITPMINVPELGVVSFWGYDGYDRGYTLDVSYSTDGVTFTPLGSATIPSSYEQFHFLLPETGDQYIAFTFAPDSGGSYTYLNFDEVVVGPAPPMGALAGTVTDGLGAALENVEVMVGDWVDSTDAAGMYSFDMIPAGQWIVDAHLEGYQPSHFTVIVDSAATTTQDFMLLSSSPEEVYSNGFETGHDPGWTFTGGANPFEVSAGFIYTAGGADTLAEVMPATGDSFLVCTPDPAGYTDNEFSWWMNLTDSDMDLTNYLQAHVSMKLWVMSESGYDYVRILANQPSVDGGTYYYLDFDINNDGNFINGYSGDTEGWVEINADLSAWVGIPDVELAILFDSDGSWSGLDGAGFGAAVDDIVITGSGTPMPGPMGLMATSFNDGEIPLSWDAPTGGARAMETYTITMDRHETENVKNDPRMGDLEPTITKVSRNYEVSGNTTRELQGYNIFRASDAMDFMLIGNTTENTFVDANTENYMPHFYFVTAVYDEGESVSSNMVEAAAGPVTDVAFGGFMEDFEVDLGTLPVGWTNTNMGELEWTVSDSANVNPTIPEHTKFAWIDDDAVGSGVAANVILTSPFIDFSTVGSAGLKFDYYFNDLSTVLAVVARVGYDQWIVLEELPESLDWTDEVWVGLNEVVGYEHVRIGFLYDDLGGWDWYAAIDNVMLETFPGPVNLAATSTSEDITLTWSDPTQQAPQFPGVEELPLPHEVANDILPGVNRMDCFNLAPFTWYYWSWYDSLSGPSSLFAFPEGPMTLDSVFFDVYQRSTVSVNGEPVSIKVTVAEADLSGATVDTIFQSVETMVSPDGGGAWRWSIPIEGYEFISTNDNFLKIHYQPMTYADSINSSLASGYVPSPLSDDGLQPTGFSGWDSAGVFYPTDYNFSLGVCGTPSYPPLSYNVYKDNMMIGEMIVDQMFVDDDVYVGEEYDYYVTAVLNQPGPNGATLIETDPSNHVIAGPENSLPTPFSLLAPTDGDTLFLDENNQNGQTLFAWTPSSDPEGEQIEYYVEWYLVELDEFEDMDTTGLATFVDNYDIYESMMGGALTTMTMEWTVWASDGLDDVEASNGPFTLTVDISALVGIGDEAAIPEVFALHQNYPNPFNPVTTIDYDIPEISNVRIVVYNIMGQKVRTLVDQELQPGYHKTIWNGTNELGMPVSSGMYFYQIHASDFQQVKKLILMK